MYVGTGSCDDDVHVDFEGQRWHLYPQSPSLIWDDEMVVEHKNENKNGEEDGNGLEE